MKGKQQREVVSEDGAPHSPRRVPKDRAPHCPDRVSKDRAPHCLDRVPKVNAPHRGPKDRAPHSPDKKNTAPVRRTKWNQQKLSPTNATEYGIRIP